MKLSELPNLTRKEILMLILCFCHLRLYNIAIHNFGVLITLFLENTIFSTI